MKLLKMSRAVKNTFKKRAFKIEPFVVNDLLDKDYHVDVLFRVLKIIK